MRMLLLRLILIGGFFDVILAGAAGAQQQPIDVPVQELGFRGRYRLMGKLHKPLGSVVTIQGVVTVGRMKGFEGPNVRVQRINGRVTQDAIHIKIRPFNNSGKNPYAGNQLPDLVLKETYEFDGYETGAFVGMPADIYKRIPLPRIIHEGRVE